MTAGHNVVRFEETAKRRQGWERVQRLSRWSRNRRLRRVLMVVWLGLLAMDAKLAYSAARLDAVSALYPTLTLFGLALWAFRRMDTGLAQPSLEDRAVFQFGEEFEELKDAERGEVFNQQIRDQLRSIAQQDERENALRLRSESLAYRALRPGLIVAVAVYWAVCLLGPFGGIRTPLAVTAIVFTWFALMVLVLPTMIRLWTEPDETGNLRMVHPDTHS